jgi:outer membrane protein assembly factor BamB
VTTPVVDVPSAPQGRRNQLVWDSAADVEDAELTGASLRVVPSDSEDGTASEVGPFGVDNLAPSIDVYTYLDEDADGAMERVEAGFSEAIDPASLVAPQMFQAFGGQTPCSISLSGTDPSVLVLSFDGCVAPLAGTAPVPIDYLPQASGLTDVVGNAVPPTLATAVATTDAAAPLLVGASAVETPPALDGPDAGDLVVLTFSESMAASSLDALTIDGVLSLSAGHSWLDGFGGLGGAVWSANNSRVEISLTAGGSPPTIAVGDVITVAPGTLADLEGNGVTNGRSLGGLFSRQWAEYVGYPPWPRSSAPMVYDAVNHRVVMVGGDALNASADLIDVWALDLATERWGKLRPGGAPPFSACFTPCELVQATGVYDGPNQRMIVFGGLLQSRTDRVWSLDLTGGAEVWSELLPSGTRPAPVAGHIAIADVANHRMVVFGGSTPALTAGGLWALDLTAGAEQWTPIAPFGTAPPPMDHPAAVYDGANQQMVLIGGDIGSTAAFALDLTLGAEAWRGLPAGAGNGVAAVYDPVGQRVVTLGLAYSGDGFETLDLAPGLETWVPVTLVGGGRGRDGHGAVYDPVGARMVVVGGSEASQAALAGAPTDTLFIALSAPETLRAVAGTVPAPPVPDMSFHAAVFDALHERLILVGYFVPPSVGGLAVWAFDLRPGNESWTDLAVNGSPSLRFGFTLAYDDAGGRMVLFAGSDSPTFSAFNDLWELDLTVGAEAWRPMSPGGSPPTARAYHTAVVDTSRRRMLVFGGYDAVGQGCPSDVLALDLTTTDGTWSQLAPAGTPPMQRSQHAAIYDAANDQMVVLGAANGDAAAGDTAVHLLILEDTNVRWSSVAPVGPTARWGHSAVYRPSDGRLILYGGEGGSEQMWELDLTPAAEVWESISPGPGPNPGERSGHSAAYDSVNGRLVLFGTNLALCNSWNAPCPGSAETWWY